MARPRKTIEELKASKSYRPSRHGNRERAEAAAGTGVPVALPALATAAVDVETVRQELLTLLAKRVTATDARAVTELAERIIYAERLRVASRAAEPGTLAFARIGVQLTAATAALDRLLIQFGMTPAARTSVPAPPNPQGARTW